MQLAGFKTLDELKKEVQDGIFDSWELDDVVGTTEQYEEKVLADSKAYWNDKNRTSQN